MMATERKVDESQALAKILNEALPDLKRLAPKYVNVNRLMALALEARMRTPILAKCSIDSIVAFCKRTAEWGTDRIGAGGVWPVPFWSSKNNCYEAVAIPDWRFIVEKAKKAGAIKHATADIVREGDVFDVVRGLNPDLTHKPAHGGTGAVTAAYCVYTLPDGIRDFQVMWIAELEKVRDSSNAWKTYLKDKTKTCPYNYWPEEMHKKAVVKRTMKLFEGASIELSQLLEADHVAMGFDRFGEQPEPIAMPKVLAAPAESEPIPQETMPEPPAPTADQVQTPDTPKDAPRLATPTSGPVISEAQAKRLFAIAKSAGWENDELKRLIASYGHEHTKEILRSEYEEICAHVEAGTMREPKAEG